jgi:hypothetical protein
MWLNENPLEVISGKLARGFIWVLYDKAKVALEIVYL